MVEQAVHVWDVLHWLAGGPPSRAFGVGRRDVFAVPGRDVTDWYTAQLDWDHGFHAMLVHSWIDPADDAFTGVSQKIVGTAGGFDLSTGVVTFRDKARSRMTIQPGNLPETKLALSAFLASVRSPEPLTPPILLEDARDAVITGLLVRKAVDERRVVTRDEILSAEKGVA